MLQHWELGQALRQRYRGFLNTSYHPQEVRLGAQDAGERDLLSSPSVLREPKGEAGHCPPPSPHAFLVTTTGQDMQGLSRTKP